LASTHEALTQPFWAAFLTTLSQLADRTERSARRGDAFRGCVYVLAEGERRVGVARPSCHDGDGHATVDHDRQRCVSAVMKADHRHTRGGCQTAEGIGVELRSPRSAELVDDHEAALAVIGRTRCQPLRRLPGAQGPQRRHESAVQGERADAASTLGRIGELLSVESAWLGRSFASQGVSPGRTLSP
jgi:hypothetical protein